jgi:hypothetical protein
MMFLVTGEGVVAVDAPPTLGNNILRAIAYTMVEALRIDARASNSCFDVGTARAGRDACALRRSRSQRRGLSGGVRPRGQNNRGPPCGEMGAACELR